MTYNVFSGTLNPTLLLLLYGTSWNHIYNWIESFFREHSHCTKFRHDVSHFRDISASIIQGSGIGPVSYMVTASDLHPVNSGNLMSKYADDTYLVIPASNANTCTAEVEHIEAWSNANNLQLNRVKSLEIVFERPRSNQKQTIPPPAVPGICRVEHVKVLGVTISWKFSVSLHVDELLAKCSQSLFALRTLRQHGLPPDALCEDDLEWLFGLRLLWWLSIEFTWTGLP